MEVLKSIPSPLIGFAPLETLRIWISCQVKHERFDFYWKAFGVTGLDREGDPVVFERLTVSSSIRVPHMKRQLAAGLLGHRQGSITLRTLHDKPQAKLAIVAIQSSLPVQIPQCATTVILKRGSCICKEYQLWSLKYRNRAVVPPQVRLLPGQERWTWIVKGLEMDAPL